MELNPQIKIIIVLCIIAFILSGIPFVLIKNIVSPPKIINQSANVTPTPIIIYRDVIVTVTPTPDGITYFAGEYQSGLRKLGRWFSWQQHNVTGYETMSGHIKIYDYRIFDQIHVFLPQDYQYAEINAPDGERFLFIFVKIYLDDIAGDNTPLWIPYENHYFVNAKGIIYNPISWEKQLRIRELEETWNDNNDFRIGYYAVFNTYSRDSRYRATAGEYAQPLYYVLGGQSNAVDGYIIYNIPKDITVDDITIMTDMYSFGSPSWTLKP